MLSSNTLVSLATARALNARFFLHISLVLTVNYNHYFIIYIYIYIYIYEIAFIDTYKNFHTNFNLISQSNI